MRGKPAPWSPGGGQEPSSSEFPCDCGWWSNRLRGTFTGSVFIFSLSPEAIGWSRGQASQVNGFLCLLSLPPPPPSSSPFFSAFLPFLKFNCILYWWFPWWLRWLKCPPAVQETWVRSLGQEDPLEKEMSTHSSTPVWKIPRTEEPGRSPWGPKELDTTKSLHFQFYIR